MSDKERATARTSPPTTLKRPDERRERQDATTARRRRASATGTPSTTGPRCETKREPEAARRAQIEPSTGHCRRPRAVQPRPQLKTRPVVETKRSAPALSVGEPCSVRQAAFDERPVRVQMRPRLRPLRHVRRCSSPLAVSLSDEEQESRRRAIETATPGSGRTRRRPRPLNKPNATPPLANRPLQPPPTAPTPPSAEAAGRSRHCRGRPRPRPPN